MSVYLTVRLYPLRCEQNITEPVCLTTDEKTRREHDEGDENGLILTSPVAKDAKGIQPLSTGS